MYKNKPLIIAKRPWWRHPVFPWGWYSLKQDNIFSGDVEGYDKPNNPLHFVHDSTEPADSKAVFMPRIGTMGRWKRIDP